MLRKGNRTPQGGQRPRERETLRQMEIRQELESRDRLNASPLPWSYFQEESRHLPSWRWGGSSRTPPSA